MPMEPGNTPDRNSFGPAGRMGSYKPTPALRVARKVLISDSSGETEHAHAQPQDSRAGHREQHHRRRPPDEIAHVMPSWYATGVPAPKSCDVAPVLAVDDKPSKSAGHHILRS